MRHRKKVSYLMHSSQNSKGKYKKLKLFPGHTIFAHWHEKKATDQEIRG